MTQKIKVTITFDMAKGNYKDYEKALCNFLSSFEVENEEIREQEYDTEDKMLYFTVKYTNNDIEGYENHVREEYYKYSPIEKVIYDDCNECVMDSEVDGVEFIEPNENDIAEYLVKYHDNRCDYVLEIVKTNSLNEKMSTIYEGA